tara:strand:+ start:3207 stop:3698 length:492 start_codon:yes stop_codon:yes gene_type:complete
VQILTSFILLIPFWFLMSGKFDLFHVALGVISITIVSLWFGKILIQSSKKSFSVRLGELFRLIPYLCWLFIEIVKSNLHVIKISLSPNIKSRINPQLVTFKTSLKHDFSKFVLANSITLTPGTVTIRISDSEFLVHALTDEVAASLPGDMESKVANVFNERLK